MNMDHSPKTEQIFNPYLPSYEYIPDGEPRVFGGRLYIYGSHDRFGGSHYCENDYVCWSAPLERLWNWHFEGIIYTVDSHPRDSLHLPVSGPRNYLYAPDVIQGLDGRYYMYYSMADSSIISVAVCDTPAGMYTYYGDVHDADGKIIGLEAGDFFQFDPGIFIDDDRRIYLYSGFLPNRPQDSLGRIYAGAHVCELEADMVTAKSSPKILIGRKPEGSPAEEFFEASSMRKINGIYYFVYSARRTGLYYYYSKFPDRGMVYGGRIHSTSDIGINGHTDEYPAYPVGNTHGGIVCLNGQYYIFDHRHTNNCSFNRQGVAEPIYFDENGLIRQAESTSCGLNGGPLRGMGVYPAYIACNLFYAQTPAPDMPIACITQDGGDRESGPGQYIKAINDGCVIGYKYFLSESLKKITLTLRGNASSTLYIGTEEADTAIGQTTVRLNTDQWGALSIPVQPISGKKPLYIRYSGKGALDMLQFSLEDVI